MPEGATGRFVAFRLMPGTDLRGGLEAMRGGIGAMAVVTCVGSLTRAVIRHANRDAGTTYGEDGGPFEIVSLTGTLGPDGPHLHASIADGDGVVRGGHVLPGCLIHTTAEVVLARLDGVAFRRTPCAVSGHDELVVDRGG